MTSLHVIEIHKDAGLMVLWEFKLYIYINYWYRIPLGCIVSYITHGNLAGGLNFFSNCL